MARRLFTGDGHHDRFEGNSNYSRFERDVIIVGIYVIAAFTSPFWLGPVGEVIKIFSPGTEILKNTHDVFAVTIGVTLLGIVVVLSPAFNRGLGGYDGRLKK
jgi:hypothetical protein